MFVFDVPIKFDYFAHQNYTTELQLAQVNLYTSEDFKSLGIESLYEKQFLILNELKASLMVKFSLMLKFHRSARAESNAESGIFTNILHSK